MSDKTLRTVLALYPKSWRERYGSELIDLMEELRERGTPSWRLVLGTIPSAAIEHGRSLRDRRRLALAAVVMMVAAAAGAGVLLYSSGPPAATPRAITVPQPPPPGASYQAWTRWAARQRSAVEATDWRKVLVQRGCVLSSVSVLPTTSAGNAGYPKGIVTDVVSVSGSCILPAAGSSSGANPPPAQKGPWTNTTSTDNMSTVLTSTERSMSGKW